MAPILDNPLRWHPSAKEFTAPLIAKKPFKLLLGRFPKGIDNTRVDVGLSPEFTNRTRLVVRRTLLHDITENYWGEPPSPPSSEDMEAFRDGYTGMMEVAVDRARKNSRFELIQLLQLSVIKFLLQVISEEFERLRERLQHVRGMDNHQSSGRSVQLHERLVMLAKEEPSIRYRLTRKLFREITKLESMRLSKLRKSVLGRSWPVPKLMLFNPILQLPSIWADEQLMNHYQLVCTDKEDPDRFDRVNRQIVDLFGNFLPTWSLPNDLHRRYDFYDSALRSQSGNYNPVCDQEVEMLLSCSLQLEEYQGGQLSWLDIPENIDRIIYSVKPGNAIRTDQKTQPMRSYWTDRRWPRFHNRLFKRLLKQFKSSGLEREILACHAAPAIHRQLNGVLPVRMICHYLSGRLNRRSLNRKLSTMPLVQNPAQTVKILDQGLAAIRSMPVTRKRRRIFSFLRHFTVFRRDMKLAHQAYWAMSRINLLSRPEELELSLSNDTLQEFPIRDEVKPGSHQIRNHVILKADLRGSTSMTSELRQRSLNPASHFSLNFFEPINQLLESYGAKKVFVEGDAVILSIFEYEDTPYQWLCVSHACGLANRILQVVDQQNAQNRQHNLPELEVGMGITFSDEAPTFLHDEEREIMISPAINRADQLSSCSAEIRRSSFGRKLGRGVEVMMPKNPESLEKQSTDKLIRYNVNGIELDLPAFFKLKSELSLKEIEPAAISIKAEGKFLAGRYPDLEGKMHWLVLREAPVRGWDGIHPTVGEELGRRFYQVITDPDILTAVTSAASGMDRLPSAASEPADLQDLTGDPDPRFLH